MNDVNREDMSNEFADINKKNKYIDYIIVGILYLIVITLSVLLVIGLKNQKKTVIDSQQNTSIEEDIELNDL